MPILFELPDPQALTWRETCVTRLLAPWNHHRALLRSLLHLFWGSVNIPHAA